jgi:cell division protein FtsQ
MNRRRAPSTARKKRVRKKPIETKPAKDKKGPKRPARRNGPARAAARKPRRSIAPKATPSRKVSAKERRARNRRRRIAKSRPPAEPRKSWRERAARIRDGASSWLTRHQGLARRAGRAVVLLGALAALMWVGDQTVRYAHTAEAFTIREIIIEGNQQLDDIDVRRAAHLQIGSNIFEVSSQDARNHLLQHPWIEDAKVARRLPGSVRIQVTERNPVALVALDQLYLVGDDGAVFKRLGVDDPVDLPVITGIASERFYDNLDYRTSVLLQSMALLQDYEGAGLAERDPVSEIHFDGANGIELFVGADGMNVRLGNGQHRQKLRRLRQVLERLELEKTRPSYVYLDNVRSPERVTVRLP